MSGRFLAVNLLAGALLIGLVCSLETWTDMDMRLQLSLFDAETRQWLIPRTFHVHWKWLVYSGAKKAISAIGITAGLLLALSFFMERFRTWRRPCLIMVLCVCIVPGILAGLREVTNIYCPDQLEMFNGRYAYQHVLALADPANAGRGLGRCFPAGHASGGFALLSLFFCFSSQRRRWAGLFAGLAAGWSMGLYQMLRGEHFLSHTLVSMIGAWMIVCTITYAVDAAESLLERIRGLNAPAPLNASRSPFLLH